MRNVLKKSKKLTALLLVVVMLVGVMAVPVSAHSSAINIRSGQSIQFTIPYSISGGCHYFELPRQSSAYTVTILDQSQSVVLQTINVSAGSGIYYVCTDPNVINRVMTNYQGTFYMRVTSPNLITIYMRDCPSTSVSIVNINNIAAYNTNTGYGIWLLPSNGNIFYGSAVSAIWNSNISQYNAFAVDTLTFQVTGHLVTSIEVLNNGTSLGYMYQGIANFSNTNGSFSVDVYNTSRFDSIEIVVRSMGGGYSSHIAYLD